MFLESYLLTSVSVQETHASDATANRQKPSVQNRFLAAMSANISLLKCPAHKWPRGRDFKYAVAHLLNYKTAVQLLLNEGLYLLNKTQIQHTHTRLWARLRSCRAERAYKLQETLLPPNFLLLQLPAVCSADPSRLRVQTVVQTYL